MELGQLDMFGDLPVQSDTTAIYPNRMCDKAQVEGLLHLPEKGCAGFTFATPKGTVIATDYQRVVYGDHGPYVEFCRKQILCRLRQKFNRELPEEAYYEWMEPMDGSGIKVYVQKKDVKNLKNPPAGGYSGNRPEGYADYRPGMIYVSPWEMVIKKEA